MDSVKNHGQRLKRQHGRRNHQSPNQAEGTRDYAMEKAYHRVALPQLAVKPWMIICYYNPCDLCGEWHSTEQYRGAWFCGKHYVETILFAEQLKVGYNHD